MAMTNNHSTITSLHNHERERMLERDEPPGILRHHANIRRLLAGEEQNIGAKKED